MSVTIRLARIGRKNLPAFRIVVTNTRSKQNGKFLDTIGSYNPTETPAVFKIDSDKVKFWQGRGAMVSDSLQKLIDGTYTFVKYPSAKKVKREAAKQAEAKARQPQTEPEQTPEEKA